MALIYIQSDSVLPELHDPTNVTSKYKKKSLTQALHQGHASHL